MSARPMSPLRAMLAALLCAAATALAAPAGVGITYEVRMNGGAVGTLTEQYQAKGGSYSVSSVSAPGGVFALVPRLWFRLTSEGTLTADGLRPKRFEGRRTRGDVLEAAADFDWTAHELTLAHDGRSEKLELPAGTQDRLSVMYEFMHRLPRAAKANRLDVHVTNGRRIDHYSYTVKRDVDLDTPLGRIRTVRLERVREGDENSHEVWLAQDRGYVPVRLVITERDGPRFEQIVTQLDTTP